MSHFNAGYTRVFKQDQLTVGLMTPFGDVRQDLAVMDDQFRLAQLADQLGFSALWVRDVPLMVPQGSDNSTSSLDDPFIWLAGMAGVTRHIALGTAAAVLPLRNPLHLAKTVLSLNRLSHGRFILGLGSGDRPAEFSAFHEDLERRGDTYRERWLLLRAALSNADASGALLHAATGGYDLMARPAEDIAMMVVGSARQSLQWIAANADAWATYHREEERQQGRIGLWQQSLAQKNDGQQKPFVQSVQLDLLSDPHAVSQPLELGLRSGRHGLTAYLQRLRAMKVGHVIFNLAAGGRRAEDVIEEIGQHVMPALANQTLD